MRSIIKYLGFIIYLILLQSCSSYKVGLKEEPILFINDIFEHPNKLIDIGLNFPKFTNNLITNNFISDSNQIKILKNTIQSNFNKSNKLEYFEVYFAKQHIESLAKYYFNKSNVLQINDIYGIGISDGIRTINFIFLKENQHYYIIDIIIFKSTKKDWVPKSFQQE